MQGRIGAVLAAAVVAIAALLGACGGARADDTPLLGLGVGGYDIIGNNGKAATQFRGEYRFGTGIFFIKPLIGAFITTDRTVYAYGGLRADIPIGNHVIIMPVAAVGYWDRGDGKDLGSHLEFKTGAELAWRFDDSSRLGIAFDHISNAGITQRNPGEENLLLVYSLPLSYLP
jgi:hypothetical protein